MEVKVIQVDPIKVAVLEHHGAPGLVDESVRHFIEWRKATGLSPITSSQTYGIAYNDPNKTPAADYWFDICGTVSDDVPNNPQGVITKTIPAGRRAVLRLAGSRDRLGESVRYLLQQWLPENGEAVGDFPVYFHYLTLGFDTPEHEHLTDIYLPLKAHGKLVLPVTD